MEFSSHDHCESQIERRLLQSVVAVARHVYAAAASSVFMVSPDTEELVFAAVSGEGQQDLVGTRFPPGTGIAGWVVASCQTMIADKVHENDRFARDAAASTGFVPTSIMAAPLVADGECIGVLEVLDRNTAGPPGPSRELDDLELLDLLATEAALSLSLLRRTSAGPPGHLQLRQLLRGLTEHATLDSTDPLAVALLEVSLQLLNRSSSAPSVYG